MLNHLEPMDSNHEDENDWSDCGSDVDSSNEEEEEVFDLDDGIGQKRKLNNQDGKPAKMSKSDGKMDFMKTPTAQEISSLKETQMLHHSNLFRLQMDELNENINIKAKHKTQIETWIVNFTDFCKNLKKSQEYTVDDRSWLTNNAIKWPISLKLPEICKGKFVFAPPSEITTVGSYASQNAIRLHPSIDLMITLPKECMQSDDWLNCRWLEKRCLYLCWLASQLKDNGDLVTSLDWVLHGEEAARPVLQVTPNGNFGQKWKFNIFPVPPKDYFKLSKFSPEKNCVRPSWFFRKGSSSEDLPATPHYNRLCAIDVIMAQHSEVITATFKNSENLSIGLKLLKTWLNQQQLNKGEGCLLNHTLTLYVIHLLDNHKINKKMSSYQVFRIVVLSLSNDDWSVKGTLGTEEFHKHYPIVFQFRSECFNVAGYMNLHFFQRLKQEAGLALKILDNSTTQSFEDLFIHKKEFVLSCDQILHVNLSINEIRNLFNKHILDKEHVELSHLGAINSIVHNMLLDTLKEGFGNRVTLLHKKPQESFSWNIRKKPLSQHTELICGLYLDPEFFDSLLTKGPSTDFPNEADKFRKFWGQKSNLRRFQDGSFHEAVLWGEPSDCVANRRDIPRLVAKYILHQHYNINSKMITHIGGQVEFMLTQPNSENCSTGEEETVAAIQAFDGLAKKLRALDLPLGISAIQSVSEVIRHSDIFPPTPQTVYTNIKKTTDHMTVNQNHEIPSYTSTIDVLMFLEISGKWPDDLKAIKAIKIEFYVKMATQLRANGIVTKCLPDYMLVFMNKYVFKVHICNRREIYLHRLVASPDEKDWEEKDTDASLKLEREIEIMPQVTTALASIQAEYKNYNSTVRLCKRWVTSQLLTDHLPSLVIDLLVAHIFKNSSPYTPPHTPHLGLLRFLNFLAQTDWTVNPILVNLNHTFSIEDEAEIMKRFNSRRHTFPPMVVATPYELRGNIEVEDASLEQLDKKYKLLSHWTRVGPSAVLLYRIKQIASIALQTLVDNIYTENFKYECLFRPSFADYDLIININSSMNSRREEGIDYSWQDHSYTKNGKKSENLIPVVNFDPVQLYVTQIRNLYKHIALFFYDVNGGNKIGVVWNPSVTSSSSVKINHLKYHQIVGVKEKQQVPNVEGIVETMKILGHGLVESIDWKKR